MTYGMWHKGIKPSDWVPDYGMCLDEEIQRWHRDIEKEKQGLNEFEGEWGFGLYDDVSQKYRSENYENKRTT